MLGHYQADPVCRGLCHAYNIDLDGPDVFRESVDYAALTAFATPFSAPNLSTSFCTASVTSFVPD